MTQTQHHQLMMLCVVGAGPVGLELAVAAVRQGRLLLPHAQNCHIRARSAQHPSHCAHMCGLWRAGMEVTVVERGAEIAANVREWQHVELFSPWSLNMSKTGTEVLKEMGAPLPDAAAFPTGRELISEYLEVLHAFLQKSGRCRFKMGTELVSIGRATFLKRDHIGANGARKGAPFRLLLQATSGPPPHAEEVLTDCSFLADCTGTWNQPNWCGAGGVPAIGERRGVIEARILQHIPTPQACAACVGKRVCVVGAGASAITCINALGQAAVAAKGTIHVLWVVRRPSEPYSRVANDPLPQRDRLYAQVCVCVRVCSCLHVCVCVRARACVRLQIRTNTQGNVLYADQAGCEGLQVTYLKGSVVDEFRCQPGGAVTVAVVDAAGGGGGQRVEEDVDLVVSCCGFRPDDALWREVCVGSGVSAS